MTRFTRYVGGLALAAALTAFSAGADAQTADTDDQIMQGLSQATMFDPSLTAQVLRQMAANAVSQNLPLTLDKSEIARRLDKLAQIDVQIQFALGSPIIRPESYATLGAIADAMHHPILWNYKFIVVGNTDTTGTRAINLKLSQERADAIVQALVTVFRVSPDRLEAVGLGQEALQVPNKPEDPVNRRVQIYTIGTLGPMGKPVPTNAP